MIKWETVLTAAISAVLVTLIVEYFAKPRLEARKERHLDAVRSRTEVLATLRDVAWAAEVVVTDVPEDIDPAVRESLLEESSRQHARMRQLLEQMINNTGRYSYAYAGRSRDMLIAYLSAMRGVLLSTRTPHRQAEIVRSFAEPIADVLDPRLRRIRRYVRSLDEVPRLIAEIEQAPERHDQSP